MNGKITHMAIFALKLQGPNVASAVPDYVSAETSRVSRTVTMCGGTKEPYHPSEPWHFVEHHQEHSRKNRSLLRTVCAKETDFFKTTTSSIEPYLNPAPAGG
jgi:hypothetical protein